MKLRLWMTMASAVLFLTPGTVNASEIGGQAAAAVPGHAQMQQNANESAQATTDMSFGEAGQNVTTGGPSVQNVSYGGVTPGQSDAGGRDAPPCSSSGPLCRLYFGR